MGSKAKAWAERLADAHDALTQVERERPEKGTDFWMVDFGWVGFAVDDAGRPEMRFSQARYSVNAENLPRLLEAARWLIDTFGDGEATR